MLILDLVKNRREGVKNLDKLIQDLVANAESATEVGESKRPASNMLDATEELLGLSLSCSDGDRRIVIQAGSEVSSNQCNTGIVQGNKGIDQGNKGIVQGKFITPPDYPLLS